MSYIQTQKLPQTFRRMAGTNSPRGFSLLEVLLVLGLIALLAGLAWPSVAALQQRQELDQACREVIATVQAARRMALQFQTAVRVEYDMRGSTTTLWVSAGDDVLQQQLPQGVRVTASQRDVLWTCQRDGRIAGGTIRLQDDLGQTVWIDCHPLSGTVSIQHQPGSRP